MCGLGFKKMTALGFKGSGLYLRRIIQRENVTNINYSPGNAIWTYRRQRLHSGLPIPILSTAGLRSRSRQRHSTSKVNSILACSRTVYVDIAVPLGDQRVP